MDSLQHDSDLQQLPNISFRHLEVLQAAHRERSYTNAALELHTTRTNVKRVCDSLVQELKHPIFEENEDKTLTPTKFGQELLSQCGPLIRSMLHLGEGIRALQRKGRILRFAASNEFFHGGAFSIILSRIDVVDLFRPCYIRMEPDRYKAALLSSECDVYFGAGLTASNRLEIIHLDKIPWSFHNGSQYAAERPEIPTDLVPGKWLVEPIGDEEATEELIKEFHKAGAKKGRVLKPGQEIADDEILIKPEPSWMGLLTIRHQWPKFHFSAVIKKQHPYAELTDRLQKASRV